MSKHEHEPRNEDHGEKNPRTDQISLTRDALKVMVVTGKSGSGKQPRIDCICNEFDAVQLSTGNIFRDLIGKFNACAYKNPIATLWNSATASFLPNEQLLVLIRDNSGNVPPAEEFPKVILGAKAKYFVESGIFVPDELTCALFESAFVSLIQEGKKVVLDGFPRTAGQYHFLKSLLTRLGLKIDFVLRVDLDDDFIVRRATGRRVCPKCQTVFHTIFFPPHEGRFCTKCPGSVEVKQRADDSTEEKLRTRLREFVEKVAPMLDEVRADGVPMPSVPGHLEDASPANLRQSVLGVINPLFA